MINTLTPRRAAFFKLGKCGSSVVSAALMRIVSRAEPIIFSICRPTAAASLSDHTRSSCGRWPMFFRLSFRSSQRSWVSSTIWLK
ncbi:Uncharacterised protein [Bordetella pertussis]|nr:Uncharacterised protein [Bordetella pertussis]